MITYRDEKGFPLTSQELDDNFRTLEDSLQSVGLSGGGALTVATSDPDDANPPSGFRENQDYFLNATSGAIYQYDTGVFVLYATLPTGGGSGASTAVDVSYDNAASGLTADDVQAAVDELAGRPTGGGASTAVDVSYDNVTSGLTAADLQAAVDELAARPTGGGGGASVASDVSFDNAASSLAADDVQAALDELDGKVEALPAPLSDASDIAYTAGGDLTATDVAGALDELAARPTGGGGGDTTDGDNAWTMIDAYWSGGLFDNQEMADLEKISGAGFSSIKSALYQLDYAFQNLNAIEISYNDTTDPLLAAGDVQTAIEKLHAVANRPANKVPYDDERTEFGSTSNVQQAIERVKDLADANTAKTSAISRNASTGDVSKFTYSSSTLSFSQEYFGDALVSKFDGVERFRMSDNGALWMIHDVNDAEAINIRKFGTRSGTDTYMSFRGNSWTGSLNGSITWDGTTLSLNSVSDERLKEDIEDAEFESCIDDIRIRKFKYKKSQSVVNRAFIAQELHQVCPEAVKVGDDPAISSDDLENPWQVDSTALIPMMIQEIQALRARVSDLEGAA
ncbi:tail fiber domain-containing protein [Sulfitobacter sp. M22]|uniref:tail fiber domain-containing protein n=1 Tax=Sulfitobacter sp. M22 TaxID=2675332 RepID=UPI001F1C3010|nr:tail fiber domain-containing protein [Sulfitobacter sp. M22]MCF7728695.1 hypothetical protein [Sulfitobacter sp. M22]